MFPARIPETGPDEIYRHEERCEKADPIKSLDPTRKADAAIKESIYRAFWKDEVLRAIEYFEIDVHVKNGVVGLNGHIVNETSQSRIENALRTVPGILEIKNHLVLDGRLTLEVASALGKLEHTYGCKFFTGVSHGVVSLNGIVSDTNVKRLAEKCAAGNPNVRAVINSVRISGAGAGPQDQPCLQPAIGETVCFLDGVPGVVRQVIINPDNRRVIAMTLQGTFTGQGYQPGSLAGSQARPRDQLIVVPMSAVRYLMGTSGILYIRSDETNRYADFDPGSYMVPSMAWRPPHPYCPGDVLFPAEYQDAEIEIAVAPPRLQFAAISEDTQLSEQLLANDALGG